MVSDPVLLDPTESHVGALVWQWDDPTTALSSAAVGGGLQQPNWLVNIGVPLRYDRIDLEEHARETAAEAGLTGTGIGLFTAANVSRVTRGDHEGVVVDATVGVSKPTWAADPGGGYMDWAAGTINIVVQMPVGLDPGAAVNAVITATEAKTQALMESGIPGTGTASDAVVIAWPTHAPPERFAGPRSEWGARIAQATHAAVLAGINGWTGTHRPSP